MTKPARLEIGGVTFSAPLFGVDFSALQQGFPAVKLVEGKWPKSGDASLIFSRNSLDLLQEASGKVIGLGDEVLLTMRTESSFAIRRFTVGGVLELPATDAASSRIVWADLGSLQAMVGINNFSYEPVELDHETEILLDSSLDSLLGAPDLVPGSESSAIPSVSPGLETVEPSTIALTQPNLGIHFLILRCKDYQHSQAIKVDLQNSLNEHGLEAQVLDWRQAAGGLAPTVVVIQVIFNIGVIFILIITCLVIMNSVSLATLDRTKEIGTMRAIGASRLRVATLVGTEMLILMAIAGIIACGLAWLALLGINAQGWQFDNQVLKALFGSGIVNIPANPTLFFSHWFLSLGLGLLSAGNPLRIALSIHPVQAIQRD
jgi:ABC-type antimicrobial peptide transport system permease subunit